MSDGFRSQPTHHAGEQKHQKPDIAFHAQPLGEKPAQSVHGKGVDDERDKKSSHKAVP